MTMTTRNGTDRSFALTAWRITPLPANAVGKRIWDEDVYGDNDITICSHCYHHNYTRCSCCDALLYEDDAYYLDGETYCRDCYEDEREESNLIHEYGYKPNPIFYGKGNRYFGIELEIDGAGRYDDFAEELLDIANAHADLLYIKTDGSLDDGMELVSHPCTMDYHINEFPNELLKFSRRSEYTMNRWAARYGYEHTPKAIMDKAKKGGNGRYAAVNLCNYHTVEFRLFRGTLKYNTFIATIQLVNRICDAAMYNTDDSIAKLSWSDFVADITEPELIQYLKERQLYINDRVEETEEY